MTESFLKVNNVTCFAHPRRLLHGVCFEMQAGDSLALLGANGIGKSTLLRMLADLKVLEIGQIIWRGGTKAYLGHQHGLLSILTPLENMMRVQLFKGYQPNSERAAYFLNKVGLPKKAWYQACQHLSAGQCRRVALAQVLAKEANLWLLDEPFAALDQQGQNLFLSLLSEHLERGNFAIMTAHHNLSCCTQQLNLEQYAST